MFTLSLGLLVAIAVCVEVGVRVGLRDTSRSDHAHRGLGAIAAAIFALLGLLLGFAFAGSMSRYHDRRQLVIQEANAIKRAYMRIDLLPSDQREMRRLYRKYLDARIEVYQDISIDERQDRLGEATGLQQLIWERTVAASRADSSQVTSLVVLPAINDMIDVTTARTLFLHTHMPTLILVLVCVVALMSGLMAGYAMSLRGRRSSLHTIAYAACVSATLFAALDLDNPDEGFIHLSTAEALLENLRQSIRE